jgi:DnaJ family protein A protein 5
MILGNEASEGSETASTRRNAEIRRASSSLAEPEAPAPAAPPPARKARRRKDKDKSVTAPPPPPPPQQKKKKNKKGKRGAVSDDETPAMACTGCGATFPSRSKLFAHLKANPGHAKLKR